MKSFWIVSMAAMAVGPGMASDEAELNKAPVAAVSSKPVRPTASTPRVLRSFEPADNRFVRLPGPAEPKPAVAPESAGAPTRTDRVLIRPGWRPSGVPNLRPTPEVAFAPPAGDFDTLRTLLGAGASLPSADLESAELESIPETRMDVPMVTQEPKKPAYPPGFAQESAVYTQRQIGHWTVDQARAIFGEPRRSRAAVGDDSRENGRIYAFRDPTNRYRELELDFEQDRGILRTVFVYPWNLTWQDCRRLWGTNVSATQGSSGRVFFSYVNRHLDVLVDHGGKVISLGLY